MGLADDIKRLYTGKQKNVAIVLTVAVVLFVIWLLVYTTPFREFLGAAPPPPLNPVLVRYVKNGHHCYTYQGQPRNFCERYGYREDAVLGAMDSDRAQGATTRVYSCSRVEGGEIVDYHFTDVREECRANNRRLTAYRLGNIVAPQDIDQVSGEILPLYRCLYEDARTPRRDLLKDPLVTVNENDCNRRGYEEAKLLGFVQPLGARPTPTVSPSLTSNLVQIIYNAKNATDDWDVQSALRTPDGAWPSDVVAGGAAEQVSSDAVTDSNGYAHVVYDAQGGIHYTTNRNGTWATSTIVDSQAGAGFPTIALGINGDVHVSYLIQNADTTLDVRYARIQPNGSISRAVILREQPRPNLGRLTPIVVDGNNVAHIIYSRGGDSPTLVHATNRTGTWQEEQVREGTNTTMATVDSAIDANGTMHVVYAPSVSGARFEGTLYHATVTADSWNEDIVESASNTSFHLASIGINQNGTIAIVYQYQTLSGGSIRHAVGAPNNWRVSDVDTLSLVNGAIGNQSAPPDVAIDANGNSHIVYSNESTATFPTTLLYATNSTGDWEKSLAVSEGRSVAFPSIVLGAATIPRPSVGLSPTPVAGCTDTDGGVNQSQAGTATDNTGSGTDFCASSEILIEHYCTDNGLIGQYSINCSSCRVDKCV